MLVEDSETLSEVLGVPITDRKAEEAQFRPQAVLDELLEQSGRFETRANLFTGIDHRAAQVFAKLPFFRSIIEFIQHPTPWIPSADGSKQVA